MRDDFSAFDGRKVKVLPISVDHTHSLKAYIDKYSLPVEMLSDFKRDVSRKYGILLEDRFYANRAYFLIDGEGVLRWSHVEKNPSDMRENSELLAAIDALGG